MTMMTMAVTMMMTVAVTKMMAMAVTMKMKMKMKTMTMMDHRCSFSRRRTDVTRAAFGHSTKEKKLMFKNAANSRHPLPRREPTSTKEVHFCR